MPRRLVCPRVTSQTMVKRTELRSSTLGPSGSRPIIASRPRFKGVFSARPVGAISSGSTRLPGPGARVEALIAVFHPPGGDVARAP